MPFTAELNNAIQSGNFDLVSSLITEEKAWDEPNEEGLKPIHVAINYGHLDLVNWLLKNYDSLQCATIPDGSTPLHVAAFAGQNNIVEHILKEYKDDPKKRRADGVTPLHLAAKMGHIETVELLLKNGAEIGQADEDGASPLFFASEMDHTTMVEFLLNREADIQQAMHDGRSPLFVAAQEGHVATVKVLLERYANIHQANANGASPLYIAAYNNHTETVKLLLGNFADIDQPDNDGICPLYIAAQKGQIEMVSLLLLHKADLNQVNNNGESSIFIAASNGHDRIVRLLLDQGAENKRRTEDDRSCLHIASYNGHTETVALLLDYKPDIRQVDKDGLSSLCIAAQRGHIQTVKLLLDRGADIEQTNRNGASPLYIAAQEGHSEIVNLLISRSARLEQETFKMRTPLWIAAYEGHTQVAQALLNDHTLKNPDNEKNTPLHIAVKQGHIPVVKLLLQHNACINSKNSSQETPLTLAAASQDPIMFGCLLRAWFQQQHTLVNPQLEHEQVNCFPADDYLDQMRLVTNQEKKLINAEQVLFEDISHWSHLPPAALTLAKATHQSIILDINPEKLSLKNKLGGGSFGEVFRVALRFGEVALKRINVYKISSNVCDKETKDILQWEITQLEKVRHLHVVELLGVVNSNSPLLLMELCDTTLDKAILKTPYEKWQVAWEVACGLAYLHSLSLVHRDIKPENILLKDGIAKIADMGLAQVDPLLLDIDEPMRLQRLIGDPVWASPEEKAASEAYRNRKGSLEDIKKVSTHATDLYRYGLVLNTFCESNLRPIIQACLQQLPQARPSPLQVLGALELNIPHGHPVLAKLCQRLGIFAHYHEYELAHFLNPYVSSKPDIDWLTYQEGIEVKGDDSPQPFTHLWQDFLSNNEKRSLDLRGAGGLGKTLLGYYQLKEQWQALRQWLINPEGNPPTLVLLLTPDYLQTTAFTIEERLAEVYQLNHQECDILKQYPVVFLLDGEDEWQARPQLDLREWPQAKTWIVGRLSTSAKDSVYLLPFNQVQIVNYLRNTLTWDEATTNEFITQLPLSAIKEVLRNPFVLSMFRLLWPLPRWQDLTKEAIYHTYFTQFIEKQQSHWLSGPYRKIYAELITHLQQEHKTLAESYLRFAGEVSLQLFEAKRLEGKVMVDSPWTTMSQKVEQLAEDAFNKKQQLLLAKKEKSYLTLQQYQAFALAHLQRFVMPVPLELGYYRFRHKSLFEYAWAYSALLPNRPLEEDEALLTTYTQIHHQESKEGEEKLDFTLIAESKMNPHLAPKAGNLLTLYNWARLPLTYDYQGAHIENANLAYANLTQANFRDTDLKNCYFAHARIEKDQFNQVPDMTVKSDRLHPPLLGHSQQILYSAQSPDGKNIAAIDRERVFIWQNQRRVFHFFTRINAPSAIAIYNAFTVVIGDKEGYVYFYLGDTRQRKLRAHFEPVLRVEFMSERHCWVGGANENTIYNLEHYTRERRWRNDNCRLTCSAFHSTSERYALGTQDGVVSMNSIREAFISNIWKYSLHQGKSTALSFNMTGNHFAIGGNDGEVVVFEQNRKLPSRILNIVHPIKSLSWSQNDQLLVAITSQGFKIWDIFGNEHGNFKAASIQAIYLTSFNEGILIEQNGSLYGITLHNKQLDITWFVAHKHFQGGITIQSNNKAFVKNHEEKKMEKQPTNTNNALLSPVFKKHRFFTNRSQSAQPQAVNAIPDAFEKMGASILSKEFVNDRK